MTRIRSATTQDIPMLMSIADKSSTAAHWPEEQYRKALSPDAAPERLTLVIEEATVQGFIVAQVLGDEWEIENVVVAEGALRKGLGSRLVKELLDLARSRSAGSVFLEVRESNQAARRLYEKSGFVLAGRRKGYYAGPPEDALLFRYDFSTEALKRC